MSGRRPHRWLAVIPGLAVCLGVPFANGVHASVAGLPFLLAWIVGCVLLTSVVMAVVAALDRAADAREAGGSRAGGAKGDRP